MTKIATEIRKARLGAGYKSQDSFAQALGLDRKTPQRWEAGRNTPSIPALRAISKATGYPIEFFLAAMAEDDAEELASQMDEDFMFALKRYVNLSAKRAVANQLRAMQEETA